jgi:hypothetical protein
MAEFRTEGILEVQVDQQSLQSARDEIEAEVGGTEIAVSTDGGSPARGSALSDTGIGSSLSEQSGIMESMMSLDEERNELLVETVDLLDEAFGGGGGGSSGGGDDGLGGSVIPDGVPIIGDGLGVDDILTMLGLKKISGMLNPKNIISRLLPSSMAGAVGVGGITGLIFNELFESMGLHDWVESFGQDLRQGLPFGEIIGDTLVGLPGIADTGAFVDDIGDMLFGDFDMENTQQLWDQRLDVWGNVFDSIGEFLGGGGGGDGVPGTGTDSESIQAVIDWYNQRNQPVSPSTEELNQSDQELYRAEEQMRQEQHYSAVDQELYRAEEQIRSGERHFGAGADPSTPGGTATAGRTRLPDSATGGSGDVSVNAPVDVRVEASIDDLERELDRRLQQIKSEILREVQQSDTTSGISARQQQSFQRNL